MQLIGIYSPNLSTWSLILWGNVFKDSFLLIILSILFYSYFNYLRYHPKTGITVFKGKYLKTILYILFLTLWLSLIIRMLADSITIALPFTLLSFYKFAVFLDETFSHILSFTSINLIMIVGLFLEIQRPDPKKLSKFELILTTLVAIFSGLFWGIYLTEGRLSLITSFPIMIILLILASFYFTKYKLSFLKHPFSYTGFIISLTSVITFSSWLYLFPPDSQFFTQVFK